MRCADCSLKETCDWSKSLGFDVLSEHIRFNCDYFKPKDETKGESE